MDEKSTSLLRGVIQQLFSHLSMFHAVLHLARQVHLTQVVENVHERLLTLCRVCRQLSMFMQRPSHVALHGSDIYPLQRLDHADDALQENTSATPSALMLSIFCHTIMAWTSWVDERGRKSPASNTETQTDTRSNTKRPRPPLHTLFLSPLLSRNTLGKVVGWCGWYTSKPMLFFERAVNGFKQGKNEGAHFEKNSMHVCNVHISYGKQQTFV